MSDGRFKAGDSRINRFGRPPSTETEFRQRLRRFLLSVGSDGKRPVDRLIESLTDQAFKGSLKAAELVLSYAYGKPGNYDEVRMTAAMEKQDPAVGRMLIEAVNGSPLPEGAKVETEVSAFPDIGMLTEYV